MGTSLLPIATLGATIKAHVTAGDRSLDKAEEHYKSAGIHLLEAKDRILRTRGLTWPAFLIAHCSLQRSRADELIAIANGTTTVAEVRARKATSMARTRAARSQGNLPPRGGKSSEIFEEFQQAASNDIDPESYERERLCAEFASLSRRAPIERIRSAVTLLRGEN